MVWQSHDEYTFQVYCRSAKQVYVVGDFNNWCTRANPMQAGGGGQWQLGMRLRPGEYRFRYLTDDGRWLTDYAAFGVIRNPLGGWDSVLYVPPAVVEQALEVTAV
jgi:1,4-alpha-glucan branching enzyme